jgi:hypothetical protein
MTQRRARSSASSSTAFVPSHRSDTTAINTPFVQPPACEQVETNKTSHATPDPVIANSRSSASAAALAPEQAVIVTSQAGTHTAQIPTTLDPKRTLLSNYSLQPRKRHCGAIAMTDELFEERAPVQVSIQVAPTASDEGATLTNSQRTVQPDNISASPSAEAEPLLSNVLPASNQEAHSGSCLGLLTVDSNSTEEKDNSTEEQDTEDESMDDETDTASISSSAQWWADAGVPPPPPRPDTAMSSDRAVSSTEISQAHYRRASAERDMRSKIFLNTRYSIRYQGARAFVTASRGVERGILPTRQTRPLLLKRRYSIDVNTTKDWEKGSNSWGFYLSEVNKSQTRHFNERFTDVSQQNIPELQYQEVDLLPLLAHRIGLPPPDRYAAFSSFFYNGPAPHNDGIFLELGGTTLHNDAFNYISATSIAQDGMEVWMRDESLDMAFEVLRRDESCDAHNIGIANSTVAQICYAAYRSEGPSAEFADYKAQFQTKHWIFIIVNDAIGGVENNGPNGTHWSLVVLDRISGLAYYYDSMYADVRFYQRLGEEVALGMLKILDEDLGRWHYRPQWYSPDQNHNNTFKYDGGACGPFVFKMSQILMNIIKGYQQAGAEDDCRLWLAEHWRVHYFQPRFNSLQVRYEIQRRIKKWVRISWSSSLVDRFDRMAIGETDVVLDDGPVVVFDIPQRSRSSVQITHRRSQSHGGGDHGPSGNSYDSPIPLDDVDENYVTYDNNSDSGDSNAASAGSDTVVMDRGEESDGSWAMSEGNTNEGEEVDLDSEAQDMDYFVHTENDSTIDVTAVNHRVTDLTEDIEEDEGLVVTRIA